MLVPLFGRKRDQAENRLEQLLLNAANDVTQRQIFLRDFLDSDVYFVGEMNSPSGATADPFLTTEPTEFSIVAVDVNGEKVAALFTSLARMQESLGDQYNNSRWVVTRARNVLKALHHESRIILNPNCSFGHEFSHEEIQLLLEGRISEMEPSIPNLPISQYQIRKPLEYPTKLIEYARRYFQERGDVKEAYLTEVAVPSRSEPWHLFIGIEVKTPGKTRFGEVLAGMDRIVRAIYPSGRMIDVVPIRSREDREKWFAHDEPFYHQ